MKYMFASDIHGSAHYCRKMLEVYRQSGAERLILLGDVSRTTQRPSRRSMRRSR